MRKLLNQPWFVGLLAAAAVAFVAHSVWKLRAPNSGGEVSSAEESTDTSGDESRAAAGTPLPIQAALKEISIPASLRDPFAARTKPNASYEKPAEPDLVDSISISAVWIQGTTTFILLNNRVHHVGDQIGRITIESATREGIWLRHWKGRDFVAIGSTFTLLTPVREATAVALSSEN